MESENHSIIMTSVVVEIADHLTNCLDNLSIQHQGELQIKENVGEMACENYHGSCAICLNKIVLQEMALIKGCEHAYCVTCILRWATYKEQTTCPQCKHPFESLNVHRSLDGSIHDYMLEESVCLLLRASWFRPLIVKHPEEADDEVFDYHLYDYQYDDDDDDLTEMYLNRSPNLRIGNRRWGDNGYVKAGRQHARPVVSQQDSAGPSRERKKKENKTESKNENNVVKDTAVGRRAKRALKREAADKAAAAKREQHLVRFGRN